MAHTPYGYKIVNGRAEIDEKQAAVVRKLFDGYIAGLGLKPAAENAGLDVFHGSAGRMLRNMLFILLSLKKNFLIRQKKFEWRGHHHSAGSENWKLLQSWQQIRNLLCLP